MKASTGPSLENLMQLVENLRAPGGCPWDQKQTHESLAPFALEEAAELADAIQTGDVANIEDELGDVLFQVVLHAQLLSEKRPGALERIINGLSNKITRRHPHVFDKSQTLTAEEVATQWKKIKAAERPARPRFELPTEFSALMAARKIGEKTAQLHFDWQAPSEVLPKVEEEWRELQEAIGGGNETEIAHEIGDVLFSVVQLARHLKLDPDSCLRQTNTRFVRRFEAVLEKAPGGLEHLSDHEKEALWQKVKREQK